MICCTERHGSFFYIKVTISAALISHIVNFIPADAFYLVFSCSRVHYLCFWQQLLCSWMIRLHFATSPLKDKTFNLHGTASFTRLYIKNINTINSYIDVNIIGKSHWNALWLSVAWCALDQLKASRTRAQFIKPPRFPPPKGKHLARVCDVWRWEEEAEIDKSIITQSSGWPSLSEKR